MTKTKSLIAPKNTLNLGQQLKLANLVKSDYAARALHDVEFALEASKELGFSVTEANVAGVRKALEIPSTRDVQRNAQDSTIAARLAKVEAWLSREFPEWRKA